MNCMASIVKYLLWIFNVIFLLCGILLITIGAIMSSNNEFSSFEDTFSAGTIAVLIIILGCVVTIISFMGCCGAIMENVCLMTTYAVCMFLVFCSQVALVVWVFIKRQQFLDAMAKVAKKVWEYNDNAHGYPMDIMQVAFNCCGLNDYTDYKNNDLPLSCCNVYDSPTTCSVTDVLGKRGCEEKFVDFWSRSTNIFRWAGVWIALLEFAVFIFACCLVMSMRKSRK